jgi:hypothetical protein
MKATIEVEFEAKGGQCRNVLEIALMRGIGALRSPSSTVPRRPDRN